MWIVIDTEDMNGEGRGRVIETSTIKPAQREGYRYVIKEWFGSEPAVYDPIEDVGDYDPTIGDPDYKNHVQSGVDFATLINLLADEIGWLDSVIPQIDAMDPYQLRAVVKRLAQENRATLKAWRYVVNRFGVLRKS